MGGRGGTFFFLFRFLLSGASSFSSFLRFFRFPVSGTPCISSFFFLLFLFFLFFFFSRVLVSSSYRPTFSVKCGRRGQPQRVDVGRDERVSKQRTSVEPWSKEATCRITLPVVVEEPPDKENAVINNTFLI